MSNHEPFLARCLSIDGEVDPAQASIFAIAAVWSDSPPASVQRGDVAAVLAAVERTEAHHRIGHNILRHVLPHLMANRPGLHAKASIDMLWRNPLAFPLSPCHHLVKHYQDGCLQGSHVNDPKRDAGLVLATSSSHWPNRVPKP